MEGFLGLLFIGAIIGIVCYYKNKRKEEKAKQEEQEKLKIEKAKNEEQQLLKEKWEEKKNEFLVNGLPTLTIDTMPLAKNEVCHFMGDACFCKIKQQTVGYEGGSRGVSFRLMKGVSFRVGNYKGHYIKKEIIDKTTGTIYLTNKKIVFSAIKNSSVVKYSDIINLNIADNMLQIQTEKKTYLFQIVDSFNFLVILESIINQIEECNNKTLSL